MGDSKRAIIESLDGSLRMWWLEYDPEMVEEGVMQALIDSFRQKGRQENLPDNFVFHLPCGFIRLVELGNGMQNIVAFVPPNRVKFDEFRSYLDVLVSRHNQARWN